MRLSRIASCSHLIDSEHDLCPKSLQLFVIVLWTTEDGPRRTDDERRHFLVLSSVVGPLSSGRSKPHPISNGGSRPCTVRSNPCGTWPMSEGNRIPMLGGT